MKLKNWIKRSSISNELEDRLLSNSFAITKSEKFISSKSISPISSVYNENYQIYIVKGLISEYEEPYKLTLSVSSDSTQEVEIKNGPITKTFSSEIYEFQFNLRHLEDPGSGVGTVFSLEVEGPENSVFFSSRFYNEES